MQVLRIAKMALMQRFFLLLLAHFGFCFMTQQSVLSNKKCSDRLVEFLKQQNLHTGSTEHGYHLIIKEKLNNLFEYNHRTVDNQMVEYKSKAYLITRSVFKFFCCHLYIVELLGDRRVKPITAAFIQVDISSCQQRVGRFDQLDPQWNVTQCAWDKVKCMQKPLNSVNVILLQVVHHSSSDYLSTTKDCCHMENLTKL